MSIENVRSATAETRASSVPPDLKIVESETAVSNAAGQDNDSEPRAGPVSTEEIKQTVESLSGSMDMLNTKLSFSVSEETDQIVVTVTNRETGEVIKQIPSEELVNLRAKMDELIGILFDTQI